jgi:hypothetical protein
MHNPLLYARDSGVKIKLHLRIYGVQTSVQPMRVFVSEFGYFRTGHPKVGFSMNISFEENPFLHATNNAGKIEEGIFENIEYDFGDFGREPYDANMESNFSSAGTLEKFWSLAEANELDQKVIFGNILSLFAKVHAGAQSWMLSGCSSTQVGIEHVCSQEFIPFFADIGIDEFGNVTVFETQPVCSFKACHPDIVEMEACYHPIVTEYGSRPATWGTTSMGFARFNEPEFQTVARRWIEEKIEGIVPIQRCASDLETFADDDCLSDQAEDILVEMVHEDYLACRLGLVDSFYLLKRKNAPYNSQIQNEEVLRMQLLDMLDSVTTKYYDLYIKFDLASLAEYFSGLTCQPGTPSDKMYFGHGEDNACRNDQIAEYNYSSSSRGTMKETSTVVVLASSL